MARRRACTPGLEGSDEPLYSPLPVASTFAAIIGAVAVTMALCARDRTGEGQRIEVPLYDAMFTAMGRHLVKFHDMAGPGHAQPAPVAHAAPIPVLPTGAGFRTTATTSGSFTSSWRPPATRNGARKRWRDFGKPLDVETADMWVQRFEETFLQKTSLEWQEAISAAGGACTVCKTVEEWLDHPHPLEARMVVEVDDANLGLMKQPGVQVRLRGTPGAVQGRAPLPGEHTDQILQELQPAASQSSPAQLQSQHYVR